MASDSLASPHPLNADCKSLCTNCNYAEFFPLTEQYEQTLQTRVDLTELSRAGMRES